MKKLIPLGMLLATSAFGQIQPEPTGVIDLREQAPFQVICFQDWATKSCSLPLERLHESTNTRLHFDLIERQLTR